MAPTPTLPITLLSLLLLLLLRAADPAAAAPACRVVATRTLDCSSLNLTAIPSSLAAQLTPSIQHLILAGNNIPALPAQAFAVAAGANLTSIDLSNNLLTSVHATAFANVSGLAKLNLASNGLAAVPANLPPALAVLNMSSNLVRQLPSPPSDAPPTVAQLKVLDLSRNLLTSVAWSALGSLQFLNLSFNRLSTPPDAALAQLRVLDLSNNMLAQAPAMAGLPVLQTLDLSYNNLVAFAPATAPAVAVRDLNIGNNNISVLGSLSAFTVLETLTVEYNLRLPPLGMLALLPQLQTISASQANQVVLPANLLDGRLPQLRALDLSYNSVANVSAGELLAAAQHSPLLAMLNLESNNFNSFPFATLANLTALTELKLGFNQLTQADIAAALRAPALTALDLQFNNLPPMTNAELRAIASPRLLFLGLGGINIFNLSVQGFANLPNLQQLDLSDCNMGQVEPGAFAGLARLRHLDISGNQLTQLPADIFAPAPGLTWLSLRRNLFKTTPSAALARLVNLTHLDLSVNSGGGSSLGVTGYPPLPKLQTLELYGNSIGGLNVGWADGLTGLVTVDLSYNSISSLYGQGLLGGEQNPALKVVDLSGNTGISDIQAGAIGPGLTSLKLSGGLLLTTPEALVTVAQLQVLDLSQNILSEIGEGSEGGSVFNHLHQLKTVTFELNPIVNISADAFDGLGRLATLDLSECSLAALEGAVFAGLHTVREVDLQGNNLQRIALDQASTEVLLRAGTVKLGNNPLQFLNCSDCSVGALAKANVLAGDLICGGGGVYNGTKLSDVPWDGLLKDCWASVPPGSPTHAPTNAPTHKPTGAPTPKPTGAPTHKPTGAPTHKPTGAPTHKPTGTPTNAPTHTPTRAPTHAPTVAPRHGGSSSSKHNRKAIIAGSVIGSLVALAVIVGLFAHYTSKEKKAQYGMLQNHGDDGFDL